MNQSELPGIPARAREELEQVIARHGLSETDVLRVLGRWLSRRRTTPQQQRQHGARGC